MTNNPMNEKNNGFEMKANDFGSLYSKIKQSSTNIAQKTVAFDTEQYSERQRTKSIKINQNNHTISNLSEIEKQESVDFGRPSQNIQNLNSINNKNISNLNLA